MPISILPRSVLYFFPGGRTPGFSWFLINCRPYKPVLFQKRSCCRSRSRKLFFIEAVSNLQQIFIILNGEQSDFPIRFIFQAEGKKSNKIEKGPLATKITCLQSLLSSDLPWYRRLLQEFQILQDPIFCSVQSRRYRLFGWL